MKRFESQIGVCRLLFRKSLWMLLAASLTLAPIMGQRRPGPKRTAAEAQPQQQQSIAIDALLAADSYKIYGEVRDAGQLIRSDGVKDLIDPIMKLAGPPSEFRSIVKWLNTRAEALSTSRVVFAIWPSRPKLPQTLVVIEFPSPEDAQKFEPQLKVFLPKMFPTPTPNSSPSPNQNRATSETRPNETPPAAPPFVLKQIGSLVFISDTPFSLKDLRPPSSKLLAEDANFRLVRDRFGSEPLFLYLDVAAVEKEEQERQQKFAQEQQRIQSEAAKDQKEAEPTESAQAARPASADETQPDASPATPEGPQTELTLAAQPSAQPSPDQEKTSGPDPMNMALTALSSSLFGGQPRWPECVGAALVQEGDSYVVRVMLVNGPDQKVSPIPFAPRFVSGPALVPEAPSILPADTELLLSLSLDFPQIYEGMVKTASVQFEQMPKLSVQPVKNGEPASPFEIVEKRLGIKIKDDLLPLLGNEIAVTIPMKVLDVGPPTAQTSPSQPASDDSKQKEAVAESPTPIFAISVKDRAGVQALLPRVIESMGLKGVSKLAQTEKRDDTERVSYANAFAYAFIGNFLVVSPDIKAIRHVVDSYLNHETLSSSTTFRNYTRWQPRLLLGQIYLSPALMESYNSFARDASANISDQLRDLIMLMSPIAQPVTYALSSEGSAQVHELHVPKNLVMLMVAGISSETNSSPLERNEAIARSAMRTIASAETTYQATSGAGQFGTLDDLIKAGLVSKDLLQNFGYHFELTVSGTKFEITAVPVEYGKTGKLSFFLDESSVLRAGDHGGGAATIADKPGF